MAEVTAAAEKAVKKAPKVAKSAAKKVVEHVDQAADVDIHLGQQVAEVGHDIVKTGEDVVGVADIATSAAVNTVYQTGHQLGRRPGVIACSALVVGLAIGGYAGYRFAEKKLTLKFDEIMAEETEKLKAHYFLKTQAKQEKPDLAEIAQDLKDKSTHEELVADLGYTPQGEAITLEVATAEGIAGAVKYNATVQKDDRPTPGEEVITDADVVTSNAFETRDAEAPPEPIWDYAAETKRRDPRQPYVIHVDEYTANEQQYEQTDLTFYEGDEVLTDSQDKVITDEDEAVGMDNLNRFGHGSGDAHTVFVRNDVREIDYEITRSSGKFAREVLGFEPDQLQHSATRRRGRFDDD